MHTVDSTRSSAVTSNCPVLGHDVMCCPLVNDCDLLAGFCDLQRAAYRLDFSDFYLPLSHFTPSMRKYLYYQFHIWYEKTRMAGLQSGEGRMMIDSVVWAQYVNVTDRQTHRQPRRRSKCRANALRRAAKMPVVFPSHRTLSVLPHYLGKFKYATLFCNEIILKTG